MFDLADVAAELKKTPGNRTMSPAEIGRRLSESVARHGIPAVTAAIELKDQGTVKQFIRMVDLPEDLRGRASWRRSVGTLPFTVASEVARVSNPDRAREIWTMAVEKRMTRKDVREAIGLYACRDC